MCAECDGGNGSTNVGGKVDGSPPGGGTGRALLGDARDWRHERLTAKLRPSNPGPESRRHREVIDGPHHFVQMETAFGGRRNVD